MNTMVSSKKGPHVNAPIALAREPRAPEEQHQTEALKIGYGGISLVAKLPGADWKTVQREVRERECRGESAKWEGDGVRNKLWKKCLQTLATEEQLTITVAHYPPATSKWYKIEHRVFSFISIGLADQTAHVFGNGH